MNDKVDIMVRDTLIADDLTLVRTAFEAAGLQTIIRVMPPRRDIDPSWLVLITFPLQTMLQVALERMGADAFERLRRLAGTLRNRPRRRVAGHSELVILKCTDSSARIVLEPDLPQDAYRVLVEQVVPLVIDGEWRYDRQRARWSRHDVR
ncbi:MAG: hypothetical protein ACRDSR_16405 [Pseudonocardiaceae bacterium]